MSDPERHSLSPKLSSVAENEIENRFHKLIVPSAPSKQETHEQKQRGSSLSGAQSPDDIGISEYRYMPHRDYYPDVPEYHRGFDGQEKVNSGKPQAQIRHDDFKNKEANPGKLQAGTWARRSKGYKEINPGDLQAENVENAARLPAPRTKNTNVIRPWRTRSKRSMSVGADVGNERDDAEQTSGGDISENPGRERRHTKRRKNIVKLETEESFDGDIAPEYDTGSLTDVLVNAADNNMEESILGLKPDEPNSSEPINPYAGSASIDKFPSPHLYSDYRGDLTEQGWEDIRAKLPADWRWDMKYTTTIGGNGKQHACITCMPMGSDEPKEFPLTIANLPVVLPVKYRWPLVAGVYPPPDPRASTPIDCRAKISLEVVRDLFLTFEHSIGFYILINGLLQVIVDWDFDIGWASSHLPNEYGGLEVCYIRHRMEPTMLQPPVKPKTAHPGTGGSLIQSLQLNDLIEARPRSLFKGKGSEGRIGLKVQRGGDPYLIMSTHVITDAILAKSPIAKITGRDKVEKLKGDWNEHVEIWAQNDKVGTISHSFDEHVGVYPSGFKYDITLIKPTNPSALNGIASPHSNMGWLSPSKWGSFLEGNVSIKILGATETHRATETLENSGPSDVTAVGQGLLRSRLEEYPEGEHNSAMWEDLIARSLLYRVSPDFKPADGYSGVALYTDNVRMDGTTGPAIIGFQSFVHKSPALQNFKMEGEQLNQRLRTGDVAFYGAFQLPETLKEYSVV